MFGLLGGNYDSEEEDNEQHLGWLRIHLEFGSVLLFQRYNVY